MKISGFNKNSGLLFRNKGLLWKLFISVAAGTVLLFWAIDVLVQHTEQRMSQLSEVHRQQIKAYGREAEQIFLTQGKEALSVWLDQLQNREQTWAAVVRSDIQAIAGGSMQGHYTNQFLLGRSVDWKIHLYFSHNPVMEVTFSDPAYHFLIRLPHRMRPGTYLPYTWVMLQIALPLALMILLSVVLYRHVMHPLRQLERATRQFSEGQFDVRVKNYLGVRDDELAALAETFDQMAERTGTLILTQRQLLGDLSHELRTPLARIDMALDCIEQGITPSEYLHRLRYEATIMRQLVEDALTLAWLNNESPKLNQEEVDLNELLQLIVDDASFEYPDSRIDLDIKGHFILPASSHRALGQALENIIRNALKYSGDNGKVTVLLEADAESAVSGNSDEGKSHKERNSSGGNRYLCLSVRDQGPGVPEKMLNDIFEPFFRVDKSRSGSTSAHDGYAEHSGASSVSGGFGLGLALARRQVIAVGGSIQARNCYSEQDNRDLAGKYNRGKPQGLEVQMLLPWAQR